MSKMWDIATYVEANPDDHDQRWRLCKKLYQAKEYRLALEHLYILKNHWDDRKRVRRYLAATCYRLEQYKQAIKELEEATRIWPEEVELYEQLAQVFYKSGELEKCAETWAKIAELNPKHKYAARAAKAIFAQARGEEQGQDQFDTDALGEEMDKGFGMSVEVTCAQCNAKNSDEFDRCWNCHAPLGKGAHIPTPPHGPSPYKTMAIEEEEIAARGNTIWILLAGAGIMALAWLYMTFSLLIQEAPEGPTLTLEELLKYNINGPRIWVGSILAVVWTFTLAIASDIFFGKHKPSHIPETLCAGFIAGGIAYLLSFLPLAQLPLVFALPAIAALPLMFWILPRQPAKILAAWAVHAVLVFVILFLSVMIVTRSNAGQWLNPAAEYSALMAYAKKRAEQPVPGKYTIIDASVPAQKLFKLEKTGSKWLDLHADAVAFHIKHQPKQDAPLRFEIYDESRTRVFEMLEVAAWSGLRNLETGKTFTINVYGPDGAPVTVEISSLLIPVF